MPELTAEQREQQRQYMRAYYRNNKERLRAYHREYRQKHREKILQQGRDYYERNKEKAQKYMRDYYQRRKEKRIEKIMKNIEVYEDELNVYVCVLNAYSACVGIGRVSKAARNAHEMFKDMLDQLRADPEAHTRWREFDVPGLAYERMILNDCLLCCWYDGSPNMNDSTSPAARAIINGSFADFYNGTSFADDCEECRLSGLLEEE